jgi:predicted nucleic-acid-binding protein
MDCGLSGEGFGDRSRVLRRGYRLARGPALKMVNGRAGDLLVRCKRARPPGAPADHSRCGAVRLARRDRPGTLRLLPCKTGGADNVDRDPGDPGAARRRPVAYEVIAKSPSLFVPLTVTLELEWVLRAFYRFDAARVIQVMEHLPGLANVNVQEAGRVAQALNLLGQGMDFADALHLAGSHHCEALYTFDDRWFARRAQRLGILPKVVVPNQVPSGTRATHAFTHGKASR